MPTNSKQSYLHGAFILVTATMLVKVIGVIFKIPLNNLLGETGMAYFNSAYTIFNVIYAIAVAGLPVAISKMVSESIVLGRYRDVKRIPRISLILFFITATTCFLVMMLGAKTFASMLGNNGAFLSILALSPAIIFTCIMSAFRGYYQGMSNMYPTAISEVVEALAKLIFGIALAFLSVTYLSKTYDATSMVMGKVIADETEALRVILQWSSAASIFGITISTAVGALYLILRHRIHGDGITSVQLKHAPHPEETISVVKKMLKISIPVCLGAIAINLTNLIDAASIMNRLDTAMQTGSNVIISMYEGLIPEAYLTPEVSTVGIVEHLYGSSGFAMSIYNLIPALTATIGISALPAVSAAWAKRSKKEIKRSIDSVIRVTCMIAFPAGLGIAFMSEPITSLLFYSRPQGAAIAAQLLKVLGIASIFLALTTPINSLLQAMGRYNVPVRIMCIGAVVKLAINYIFVAVPQINIKAAPYGTLFCYITIVLLSLYVLQNVARIRLDYKSVFIKPLIGGIMCAVAARVSYDLLSRIIKSHLITVVAILIGVVMYTVVMALIRGIKREDVLMLPKGEILTNLLEKFRIIM